MNPLPPLPHTLTQAMARMEGFYAEGTTKNRPQRNHNPGNIEYGVFAISEKATGSDGRYAIFPDDETGFRCFRDLLSGPHYRALTLRECIERYAPPNENNSELYLTSVCEWRKCSETDIVLNLLEEDLKLEYPTL